MENLKKSLSAIICAFLSLFGIFFLFANYVTVHANIEFNSGSFYEDIYPEETISGFGTLGLWSDYGFGGVMVSIIQILVLITITVMLAISVLAILRIFAGVKILPDKILKIDSCRLPEFSLYAYLGLQTLLFVFLLVLVLTGEETAISASGYGSGYLVEDRVFGAGYFVMFGISLLCAGAAYLLQNVLHISASDSGDAQIAYVCTKCGASAKAKDKFCTKCGGAVEVTVKGVDEYLCTKCGAVASAKDKFCSKCGGAVVKTVKYAEENLCSKCGAKADEGAKFCSFCGGAVIKTVKHKEEYVCSGCGAKAKEGVSFCSLCGGKIEKKVILPASVSAPESIPAAEPVTEASSEGNEA